MRRPTEKLTLRRSKKTGNEKSLTQQRLDTPIRMTLGQKPLVMMENLKVMINS